MNRAFDLRMGESHIEVYKFRTGAIPIATLLALVIQAWLPLHFTRAALLDLPLLVVIYLGLSRRNPSTGLLLGTAVGLMQDSLSGPTVPLGLFGIAKTVIGYLASSLGARLDTEHPAARFALTAGFFVTHQAAVAASPIQARFASVHRYSCLARNVAARFPWRGGFRPRHPQNRGKRP